MRRTNFCESDALIKVFRVQRSLKVELIQIRFKRLILKKGHHGRSKALTKSPRENKDCFYLTSNSVESSSGNNFAVDFHNVAHFLDKPRHPG